MIKPNHITIYVITRGDYGSRNYFCYLNEIFFSKKQAKKYCKAHNIHPLFIKKLTLRGEKKCINQN